MEVQGGLSKVSGMCQHVFVDGQTCTGLNQIMVLFHKGKIHKGKSFGGYLDVRQDAHHLLPRLDNAGQGQFQTFEGLLQGQVDRVQVVAGYPPQEFSGGLR